LPPGMAFGHSDLCPPGNSDRRYNLIYLCIHSFHVSTQWAALSFYRLLYSWQ